MGTSSKYTISSSELMIASAILIGSISLNILGWLRFRNQEKESSKEEAYESCSSTKILERRREIMCRNQSISYSSEPLVIVKGRGSYLIDHNGKEYLDCVNNVAHVGHCHPKVVQATNRQMALLNTNTRYLHPARIEYMERLLATFPEELSVCFMVCTGTEANDLALRLAKAATNNAEDIIVIDGAYHGHSESLINISPYKFSWQGKGETPRHVHKVPVPDQYRGKFGEEVVDAGERYGQDVCDVVSKLKEQGKRPAAFFAESILGCCGQVVLPQGYLKTCYKAVRGAGGVCVADEVQVGFGRSGKHFWVFQSQEVVPDIVTMGKPIGNGYPMAAVVTTKAIAAKFNNGIEYFNTFGGSTAACVVGTAVLDVIETERLQENALEVGTYLKEGFERLMAKYDCIGHVRGMGLFLGLEIVKDKKSKEPDGTLAALLAKKMKRDFRVLISLDGPTNSVIKIKPPLCFSFDCAKKLLTGLEKVLDKI